METHVNLICKICNNSLENKPFKIKEMHFGTFQMFDYFECVVCKCIQIVNVPKNMHEHYPEDYYSYSFLQKRKNAIVDILTSILKRELVKYYSGKLNLIGFMTSWFYKNPFPWLIGDLANFNARFLDVGSGTGKLLLSMQRSGFKKLTGIDPFLKQNINYDNGVVVLKQDIFRMEGIFDIIMLHHSFEHMESPLETLKKLRELLSPNGIVIIRIPIAGGYAWRKYRESWVQLDAPRHFFIHSVQSIELLSAKAGFKITNIIHDSSVLQFIGSEKYLRGIPLMSNKLVFNKNQLKSFQNEANRLNKIMDGDAACFYLER